MAAVGPGCGSGRCASGRAPQDRGGGRRRDARTEIRSAIGYGYGEMRRPPRSPHGTKRQTWSWTYRGDTGDWRNRKKGAVFVLHATATGWQLAPPPEHQHTSDDGETSKTKEIEISRRSRDDDPDTDFGSLNLISETCQCPLRCSYRTAPPPRCPSRTTRSRTTHGERRAHDSWV